MSANTTYTLGCTFGAEGIHFALRAPLAEQVTLCIYQKYDKNAFFRIPMQNTSDGIWQYYINGFEWENYWYTYSIQGPSNSLFFEQTQYEIADPYAHHVANTNHYLGYYKSLIKRPNHLIGETATRYVLKTQVT